MIQPKTLLVGASGVGKTTLASHINSRYGLPWISGATQMAAREIGIKDWSELETDLEKADAYQMAVWWAQQHLEKPFWESEEQGFVSDRGPDLAVYTARMCRVCWQIVKSEAFQEYMTRLRLYGLVIFIRPHPDLQPIKDGRRDKFLTQEWVYGMDAAIEFLLESHEVPFISINTPSLKDRVRTIDRIMSLAIRK